MLAWAEEREMQAFCAVLESTSRELFPERFRTLDRGDIQKADAATSSREARRRCSESSFS